MHIIVPCNTVFVYLHHCACVGKRVSFPDHAEDDRLVKVPKRGESPPLPAGVVEAGLPRSKVRTVEVLEGVLAEFRKETREVKEMVSFLDEKVTKSLTPKKGKSKAGTPQVRSYIDICVLH